MANNKELPDKIANMLAGRAAEEIALATSPPAPPTPGAGHRDRAAMITRYGMTERLGPRAFGHDPRSPSSAATTPPGQEYSDETARKIDDEIRRIVEEAHQTAKDILVERRQALDTISKILLARETIDAEQFAKLLDGAPEDEVFGAEDEETTRSRPARGGGREVGQPRGPAPDAASAPGPCRRHRRDARRRPERAVLAAGANRRRRPRTIGSSWPPCGARVSRRASS